MINLLAAFRREDHPNRLNREFHLHLTWWSEFFTSWNGQSFFLAPQWGYLYVPLVHRFNSWSVSQLGFSIAYKELFPIAIVVNLCGHDWSHRRVEFLSHNKSVVDVCVLQSGTAKDPNLMIYTPISSPFGSTPFVHIYSNTC